MLKSIALGLTLTFAANPLAALCTGNSFMDRLTTADRDELTTAIADTPYPRGLVWEATRGEDTITLIGTMHIYDARLDPIRLFVKDRVTDAELLLVEATEEEEAQLLTALATDPDLAFINDGPTLPERLDDETWSMIEDAARARQIPPFLAAKMQPWYLMLSLSVPPCAMNDLIAGVRGLDQMVMEDATGAGVPIRAIESYDTLIKLLATDDFDAQMDMLRLSLLAPDMQSEMFVAMLDSYFSGEIAEVWEASRIAMRYLPDVDAETGDAMFAEMEDALLTQRNLAWIPVILDAAREVDTFAIAVGAAHLPGDTGILTLLEAEGFSIKPLG